MFIPGWKDLIKTLWIALLFGGWAWIAIPIFESEGFLETLITNPEVAVGVIGLLVFVFPFCSIAIIHHVFFGKRAPWLPAWVPTGPSWWEAFWVYGSFMVGLFTPVVIGRLGIMAWNHLFQFAVIDIRTTAEAMGRNDYFIGALVIIWFYIIALGMKLQRWSNRPKEKPPAIAEGNTK
jgi:hypothetical protein